MSAVSQLNREGEIANEHIARIVRRGLEYNDRTDGVFDIYQGRLEHELKTFLRGDSETPPDGFDTGTVRTSGPHVTPTSNSISMASPKGTSLTGRARHSAVLVEVSRRVEFDRSPVPSRAVRRRRGAEVLVTLVADGPGERRSRDGTDHVYDPTTESLGSRHELVTVVVRRDCMEADALATTIAALPLAEARD